MAHTSASQSGASSLGLHLWIELVGPKCHGASRNVQAGAGGWVA